MSHTYALVYTHIQRRFTISDHETHQKQVFTVNTFFYFSIIFSSDFDNLSVWLIPTKSANSFCLLFDIYRQELVNITLVVSVNLSFMLLNSNKL